MHSESQPRLYWAFKSHPPQQVLYSKHHECLCFHEKSWQSKWLKIFYFLRIINLPHKKHNQNLWPVQWWLVHAVWECSQRWYNGLLSHSQQFSPSLQIHPHSIKTSNYVLGYHSVQRQKGRKLQSTGYQKRTPHQQRGDVLIFPPNVMPPKFSLLWIHERNSHPKNPYDPDNIRSALNNCKFKLTETGYKIQEINTSARPYNTTEKVSWQTDQRTAMPP